jgi:hypothetical protein
VQYFDFITRWHCEDDVDIKELLVAPPEKFKMAAKLE